MLRKNVSSLTEARTRYTKCRTIISVSNLHYYGGWDFQLLLFFTCYTAPSPLTRNLNRFFFELRSQTFGLFLESHAFASSIVVVDPRIRGKTPSFPQPNHAAKPKTIRPHNHVAVPYHLPPPSSHPPLVLLLLLFQPSVRVSKNSECETPS